MPALMPPYIRPADTAGAWLKGRAISAQIQVNRERLAAQAQQDAMANSIRQQQIAQQARLAQQQAEIAFAYHQAQLGIEKGRLDEAQRMNDFRLQQAMQEQAAARELEGVAAGGGDVIAETLKRAGRLGLPGSSIASLAAAQGKQATTPEAVQGYPVMAPGTTNAIPGMVAFQGPSGRMEVRNIPSEVATAQDKRQQMLQNADVRAAYGRLAKAREESLLPGGDKKEVQSRILAEERKINQLFTVQGMEPPFPESAEGEWGEDTLKTSGGVRYRIVR